MNYTKPNTNSHVVRVINATNEGVLREEVPLVNECY